MFQGVVRLIFMNSFHTVTEVRWLDGILFYWLIWCGWITAFFLMKRSCLQAQLTIHLLIVISLSQCHFVILHERVNATFLYVLLLAFYFLKRFTIITLLYHMMCFLIIGMMYFLEQLYLLIDPSVLLLISPWMLCIPIVLLCHFLTKAFRKRLLASVIGMCWGAVLYSFALNPLPHTIGNLAFLDNLGLTTSLIIAYHVLQQALRRLKAHYTPSL